MLGADTSALAPQTCEGNYVLSIQDPTCGDWAVIDCPGCDDCDRGKVAARLVERGEVPADAFASLPNGGRFDEEEW